MKIYDVGVASVSFRQHTPREIIESAKKSRLRFIEWGSDIHAPFGDIHSLSEIARLQCEYGIECSSYGTYFKLGETDINLLHDYISAAKILGADILRLWCGNRGSEKYTQKEKAELFSECLRAAEIAEKYNVTLCMECHRNTFTDEEDAAQELMQTVNSYNFRMYWQPNQFKSAKENFEYMRQLNPYITHIHVFNWKEENRSPLSQGIKEWRQYLSLLDGRHTLLLEFMPDGKIESLEKEAASLRKLLEE